MRPHLYVCALIYTALAALSGPALAEHPQSFTKAKKVARSVYEGHQTSFYCGCSYAYQGNKAVPDFRSCSYRPRTPITKSGKRNSRVDRIEWEHVVPAHAFGHQLRCWQEGGRKGCRKDPAFRVMESDLHNLTPAVGEVNGDRNNFRYAMLPSVPLQHGDCPVRVDFKGKRFEPPASRRGDIARTYFYFRDRYGLAVSKQQERLFKAWARQDPVDNWEREREKRIRRIQGNGNAHVSGEGRVERATGFEGGTTGAAGGFRCDKSKTKCSQMESCAEAKFYLKECGRKRFDRNKDGVPCESICR
jgi:deoxyribonuclease-1